MLSSILLSPENLNVELKWQSTADKYGTAIVCHPQSQATVEKNSFWKGGTQNWGLA